VKKILIAVDDTKGRTQRFLSAAISARVFAGSVVLLFVERFEGKSLIAEMLATQNPLRSEKPGGSEYKRDGQEGACHPGPLQKTLKKKD